MLLKDKLPKPLFIGFILLALLGCLHTGEIKRTAPGDVSRGRMALLPFENLNHVRQAARDIMAPARKELESFGYQLVGEEEIEEFLRRERIRHTGSLSHSMARKLSKELGVGLIFLGTTDLYMDGSNPQVGISGKLISARDGNILWADSEYLTGKDFTGLFGLGTVETREELAQIAVKRLLKPLVAIGVENGKRATPLRGLIKPPWKPRPIYYLRSPESLAAVNTLAVLPFENVIPRVGAGRIASNLFVSRLLKTGKFRVVEPGEVREQVIRQKIRANGEIDLSSLKKLGKMLGVDAFILGRVYAFSDGQERRKLEIPRVEISARMLEVRTGKILWAARYHSSGEDYVLLLDFGKERSVTGLLKKMIEEMVGTIHKKSRSLRAETATRLGDVGKGVRLDG